MDEIPVTEINAANGAAQAGDVVPLADFLRQYGGYPQVRERYRPAGIDAGLDAVENARRIIANTHYFDSWADYEQFRQDLQTDTGLKQFELAADAIVTGDAFALENLLKQNPTLISMRSRRNHHATLLNYVGANGFEGYRQKTPQNAVAIAMILLNAGAEVDAWGSMYGGTSTLGLVATSVHPVITGVQQELMEVLISRGADPNRAVAPDYTGGNLILACLHNGRGEPVKYLANHGAEVELEGAGGIGDLEKVKSYFTAEGLLIDKQLETKRNGCMIWACVYGHRAIVDYLLDTGLNMNIEWDGTTPLHSAAFGGQLALVKLLLEKGAAMETLNSYGGTVLGTTLWALYNDRKPGHLEIMETLIAAGAAINDEWWNYINEIRGEKGA